MVIPPELIEQISSMGIKDFLSLIISGKYGADAVKYFRERIREQLDKENYGFVPNAEESKAIYEINKKDVYQRLKSCLGGHWALDLLRVGIYISKLNNDGKRDTVKKIREHVHSKYGIRGVKIIDMGATSIIESVASYLSDRKMRDNMNPLDLALEFDKLIDGWEKVTIFVKRDENESLIYKKIVSHMDNHPLFMVFAYGSAVMIASRAIAKLNNEKVIQNNRYFFYTYPNFDQAGLQNNAWVFEQLMRDTTDGLF